MSAKSDLSELLDVNVENPTPASCRQKERPKKKEKKDAKMSSEDLDQQSGGLLRFFRLGEGEDMVSRLVSVPQLRKYAADATFVKKVKEISRRAMLATSADAMSEVTRSLMLDPRLTQCAMLGAGVQLSVGEDDLKKAEREGDIDKRSPLKVDDLVESESCGSPEEARQLAKAAYDEGDVPKALAYWTRALRIRRHKGLPDDAAEAAGLYANIAQGLLKMEHYVRAEQAATRALAYVEDERQKENVRKKKDLFRGGKRRPGSRRRHHREDVVDHMRLRDANGPLADDPSPPFDVVACERKALFRRAVAREGRRRFASALEDANRALSLAPTEESSRKLVKRLESLVNAEKKEALEKVKRKAEEKEGFKKRGQGVALERKQDQKGLGYVEEKDYSSLLKRRFTDRLADIDLDLGQGASVKIAKLLEDHGSISATVNAKRGNRSLYYDLDITANWTAEPAPDFDISQDAAPERKPISGTIRLYNVSHETRYEPGADPNVAYMYQLGYRLNKPKWFDGSTSTPDAPVWARQLIDGAHNLYEAAAHAVDATIADLKTQLD